MEGLFAALHLFLELLVNGTNLTFYVFYHIDSFQLLLQRYVCVFLVFVGEPIELIYKAKHLVHPQAQLSLILARSLGPESHHIRDGSVEVDEVLTIQKLPCFLEVD